MKSNTITSRRLELVPLDIPALQALLDGAPGEALSEFTIPDGLALNRFALQRRVRQLERDPALLPWLMRAVVIRATSTICGRIGFHSRPGAEELRGVAPDGVEFGYEIDPDYRRRGYATEAAIALMRWAYDLHGQRSFVLSISPHNEASLALANRMGFVQVGSQMDEVDGLELVFTRRFDAWPAEWSNDR